MLFSTNANSIVSSSVEDIFSEKRKSCRIIVTFLCNVVLENKSVCTLFCCMLTFIILKHIVYKIIGFLYQVCTNPRRQCTRTTKICTVALNVFGPTVWNFLHVTHLAPRILSWLLSFGKFVRPFRLLNTGSTPFYIFISTSGPPECALVLELYRRDQLYKIHNRYACSFDRLSIRKVLSAAVHITTRRGTSALILWIENFDLGAYNYMQCKHWHSHEFYWINFRFSRCNITISHFY